MSRNARPHPVPLPQEKEKHSPASSIPKRLGESLVHTSSEQKAEAGFDACEPPSGAAAPSLSPKERAGVRASVSPIFIAVMFFALLITASCGHKHENGDRHDHSKEDGHKHEAESQSGASFNANRGVMLTEETRKILGVEVSEVAEQKLPAQIHFNLQVFGEKHRHALPDADHTGCDVHGSGFLPPDKVTSVRAGQPVQVQTRDNTAIAGVVLAIEPALALGETEVIVGLTNATEKVKPGEFLSAVITQAREDAVMVIPRSALLRTSEGTFVYAVNGKAYMRTAVKIGAEADGKQEITDGLLAGDSVVTRPVETLWLIELRAAKGGGHSH